MHRLTATLLASLQVGCSFDEGSADIFGFKLFWREHTQFTFGILGHLGQTLLTFIHVDVGVMKATWLSHGKHSHNVYMLAYWLLLQLFLIGSLDVHVTWRSLRLAVTLLQLLPQRLTPPLKDILLTSRTDFGKPGKGREAILISISLSMAVICDIPTSIKR